MLVFIFHHFNQSIWIWRKLKIVKKITKLSSAIESKSYNDFQMFGTQCL